jgi:hypothetical protein
MPPMTKFPLAINSFVMLRCWVGFRVLFEPLIRKNLKLGTNAMFRCMVIRLLFTVQFQHVYICPPFALVPLEVGGVQKKNTKEH